MDPRPTEDLTLPECKAKVVMYQFLTGGQLRDIQKIFANEIGFDPIKGKSQELTTLVKGSVLLDAQEKALLLSVKSINLEDGTVVDNISDFIYQLSPADSNLLYERANALIGEKSALDPESKKK